MVLNGIQRTHIDSNDTPTLDIVCSDGSVVIRDSLAHTLAIDQVSIHSLNHISLSGCEVNVFAVVIGKGVGNSIIVFIELTTRRGYCDIIVNISLAHRGTVNYNLNVNRRPLALHLACVDRYLRALIKQSRLVILGSILLVLIVQASLVFGSIVRGIGTTLIAARRLVQLNGEGHHQLAAGDPVFLLRHSVFNVIKALNVDVVTLNRNLKIRSVGQLLSSAPSNCFSINGFHRYILGSDVRTHLYITLCQIAREIEILRQRIRQHSLGIRINL